MNNFTKEELESIFQAGDTAYNVQFVVTKYIGEPFADSVCFKKISDTPYTNGDAFKSKNKAIDTAISKLKELYDE